MDFILNEVEVESGGDFKLVFSDDKDEMVSSTTAAEDRDSIDNSCSCQEEDRSFYRHLDNREHYPRFINQARDPLEVVNELVEEFYGEDDMPDMYDPEKRKDIDFDLFDTDHDRAMQFKNNLVCFSNVENRFFLCCCFFIPTRRLFLPADMVEGNFPLSEKFLQNKFIIFNNRSVINHSHRNGKILGHAHEFSNDRVRENYYTIPVFACNQFRFDFSLFLKGLRRSVPETTRIEIGGKNPTDVNFTIIKHEVRFIDTVKYIQQSL